MSPARPRVNGEHSAPARFAWPWGRWGYTPTVTAVLVLLGFLALTYVGYIGPWEQAGPPF